MRFIPFLDDRQFIYLTELKERTLGHTTCSTTTSVFYLWRYFAKFRPEKYNFDLHKMIFHGKNSPNSPDFEPKKKFQIAKFYDNFQ
jgi:hypothetical protein